MAKGKLIMKLEDLFILRGKPIQDLYIEKSNIIIQYKNGSTLEIKNPEYLEYNKIK